MEAQLLEMDEQLKKVGIAMETLQRESESLRQKTLDYDKDAAPSHNEQLDGEHTVLTE